MTIDQELHYNDWSPIKVNDWINGAMSIIKSIVGWLGIIVLFPLLVLLLLVAYLIVRYLTTKLVKKLNSDEKKLIDMLNNPNSENREERIRYVMEYQIELSKKIQEYRERNMLRNALPKKILRPFFNQEDKVSFSLKRINDSLKDALYPSHNKKYSQEELSNIAYRSEGVPDLDDKELDRLMDSY